MKRKNFPHRVMKRRKEALERMEKYYGEGDMPLHVLRIKEQTLRKLNGEG